MRLFTTPNTTENIIKITKTKSNITNQHIYSRHIYVCMNHGQMFVNNKSQANQHCRWFTILVFESSQHVVDFPRGFIVLNTYTHMYKHGQTTHGHANNQTRGTSKRYTPHSHG